MLEDRGLIRDSRLRELEKAVRDYQGFAAQGKRGPVALEELRVQWAIASQHIERIHEAIHQLREALRTDMVISYVAAGFPLKELPRLPQRQPLEAVVDLRGVRTSLLAMDTVSQASRQIAALEVVQQIIAYISAELKKILGTKEASLREAEESEPAHWATHLMALVNGYGDQAVAGAQEEDFAGAYWKIFDDELRRRLEQFSSPITWVEILFHFLRSLEDHRGEAEADRRRRQIARYFTPRQEFYCVDCDRPFALDSRHPSRLICPRCRAKRRKRQERQRNRSAASISRR